MATPKLIRNFVAFNIKERKAMSEQIINRPIPVNEEVAWDKTKTIISTTDRFGNITDVNQTFIDVCGYTAAELLGQPHNIIRHPDMPKIVFKITWDNMQRDRRASCRERV